SGTNCKNNNTSLYPVFSAISNSSSINDMANKIVTSSNTSNDDVNDMDANDHEQNTGNNINLPFTSLTPQNNRSTDTNTPENENVTGQVKTLKRRVITVNKLREAFQRKDEGIISQTLYVYINFFFKLF